MKTENKKDNTEKSSSNTKKKVKKESVKTFKNNSAFKRAMNQFNVQSGDKIIVSYVDGATYTVERS